MITNRGEWHSGRLFAPTETLDHWETKNENIEEN